MSKIEKLKSKISMDMCSPYYHDTDWAKDDLLQFQKALKEKYNLELSIEKCCVIWEKFSTAWSAQFMTYSEKLVDVAIEEYLNSK
jgi:hypothetical protein